MLCVGRARTVEKIDEEGRRKEDMVNQRRHEDTNVCDVQNISDPYRFLQVQDLPRMETPTREKVSVYAVCEDAWSCPFYARS